jgi:hypothetical protein
MLDFPNSASEVKELEEKLAKFLKGRIQDTYGRPMWTKQNYRLLDQFFRDYCTECRFTGSQDGPEFLWDFTGYRDYQGMLITAESEHDTDQAAIAEDFDRLLYGISPLKLMMCRIDTRFYAEPEEEAERIRSVLEENLRSSCKQYSSGETSITYCVCWADMDGDNQDFAYPLQIEGEPKYKCVGSDRHFHSL